MDCFASLAMTEKITTSPCPSWSAALPHSRSTIPCRRWFAGVDRELAAFEQGLHAAIAEFFGAESPWKLAANSTISAACSGP
jgi:hypothetical protein